MGVQRAYTGAMESKLEVACFYTLLGVAIGLLAGLAIMTLGS